MSFSKYAYLDTNILGLLSEKPHLLPLLNQYLVDNQYKVVLSEILAMELSDSLEHMRDKLQNIIYNLPVIMSKPAIQIIIEEIEHYPAKRNLPLEHPELNEYPALCFMKLMESSKLKQDRVNQKNEAKKLESVLEQVKPNFVVQRDKPIPPQANLFAHHVTVDNLRKNFPNQLLKIYQRYGSIDNTVFQSFQIQNYINFYRYYVEEESSDPHDHADNWHMVYLPYCHFALIEQRLCDVINQVQKKNEVFTHITVRNNRFVCV